MVNAPEWEVERVARPADRLAGGGAEPRSRGGMLDCSASLGDCGMTDPLARSKRMTLCTPTSWLMPLCDQMFCVTASQSPRNDVNEP